MRKSVLLMACLPLLAVGQSNLQPTQSIPSDLSTANSDEDVAATDAAEPPPMLGIVWAKGFEPNARANEANNAAGADPNLIFHGGKILPFTSVVSIFWGPTWTTAPGDKITGMDKWYKGFTGSKYAGATDEYTGSNGKVGSTLLYHGHIIDTTTPVNPSDPATLATEVCKFIKTPTNTGDGYYPVYTDTPRGNAQFCAFHSHTVCSGIPVQFAFFWKLDGDPGCDPKDASGLHSQGLAAIANVSGHELSEARSDPTTPGAWFDAQGQENGDKCNFTFAHPLVTFSDGTQWKVQSLWSNNAFTAGTGFANRQGQPGCFDGN